MLPTDDFNGMVRVERSIKFGHDIAKGATCLGIFFHALECDMILDDLAIGAILLLLLRI